MKEPPRKAALAFLLRARSAAYSGDHHHEATM
jgi:hypothetical protein